MSGKVLGIDVELETAIAEFRRHAGNVRHGEIVLRVNKHEDCVYSFDVDPRPETFEDVDRIMRRGRDAT